MYFPRARSSSTRPERRGRACRRPGGFRALVVGLVDRRRVDAHEHHAHRRELRDELARKRVEVAVPLVRVDTSPCERARASVIWRLRSATVIRLPRARFTLDSWWAQGSGRAGAGRCLRRWGGSVWARRWAPTCTVVSIDESTRLSPDLKLSCTCDETPCRPERRRFSETLKYQIFEISAIPIFTIN